MDHLLPEWKRDKVGILRQLWLFESENGTMWIPASRRETRPQITNSRLPADNVQIRYKQNLKLMLIDRGGKSNSGD